MDGKWEVRIIPQIDGTVIAEFWCEGIFKFKIKGYGNGVGEVLTKSGHYRGSLIPNNINGLMVTTKRPDSVAE